MPKEKKEEIINETFLDKCGKEIKIKDVIDKSDCWASKGSGKFILTHKAIKHIAELAGISKNFDVTESPNINPDYRNELEYIVRVTIHCRANGINTTSDDCVHGERHLTITGESNRINTANRGREYLRKMAEKRAYDIAVLEHLGLYSAIYSEEESPDFEPKKEPVIMPGTLAFEAIVTEINAILASPDVVTLKKVGRKIKAGVKVGKYSKLQIEYLRDLFTKHHAKKLQSF